jgi:5-methylcytosine-specific restriction endonuclease McrA
VNPETPVPPLSPRVPPLSPTVPPVPQRRVAPLSPGRYELRLTISQELHDKIKQAQELISHSVPSGDIAQILERALDELIAKQEKLQFAATDKPRTARGSSDPHYVPASVRRAVRKRDRARCTYQSGDGVRCGARKFLQYDHVIPVARGGTSTVGNVRLRCRAHNQLEAERVFGAGFMEAKRAGRFHEIHRLDRH